MSESAAGPRRRDKHESREALIRAAFELFAEQGYDGPSLSQICARAGYTRGVFYVHFASRDELVAAVMERGLQDFIDDVLRADPGEPGVAVILRRFLQRLETRGELARSESLRVGAGELPFDGFHFYRLLEACVRAPNVRAEFARLVDGAVLRIASALGADREAGRLRAAVPDADLAGVALFAALGALVATELDVPIDPARVLGGLLDLARAADAHAP